MPSGFHHALKGHFLALSAMLIASGLFAFNKDRKDKKEMEGMT